MLTMLLAVSAWQLVSVLSWFKNPLDTNLLVTPTWSVRVVNPRRLRFHLLLGNFNTTGGANAAPLYLRGSNCISNDWVIDRSSALPPLTHHFR